MFEQLSSRLQDVFGKLTGGRKLTEQNIRDGMEEVRRALLEADVNYSVVTDFTDTVTKKAVGTEVLKRVDPGQQIVKIVNDELIELLGAGSPEIAFPEKTPAVIMLSGLQGSGKTTTSAKLGKYLESQGKKPLLVGADLQRPAAVDQIERLGEQTGLPVYVNRKSTPPGVCAEAVEYAKLHGQDVVILDTAGRLHIDADMMGELRQVASKTKPHQIYLVCDAMTGQDAVNSAREFNEQLELDGIILTKLDGDARGGAALSIKAVTGKPIKFAGIGEKLDKLEPFFPDRMASRILGMGDVVGLVEKVQQEVTEEEAKKLEEKLKKNRIDFDDFLKQLQMIRKMGSLREVMGMIPGLGSQLADVDIDESEFKRIEAIIQSMTSDERGHPEILMGSNSRKHRIARGAGTNSKQVNALLKQFEKMKKMMSKMNKFGGLFGGGPSEEDMEDVNMGEIGKTIAESRPGTRKQVDRKALRKKRKKERKRRKNSRKKK